MNGGVRTVRGAAAVKMPPDALIADVIVIGSGAAGLATAVTAAHDGCDVLLFEKAATLGGTTAKSGGVYWVPDNHLMRAHGIDDSRDRALRYMARVSAPTRYDPEDHRLGMNAWEFGLLAEYCELAPRALAFLDSTGALRSTIEAALRFPDYHMHLPEQGGVYGRALCPADAHGQPSGGAELVNQLAKAARRSGVRLVTRHTFTDLLVGERRIQGVQVRDRDTGKNVLARARAGVVLATGGFTHNAERRARHLPARVWGGCAAGTNTGDALPVLESLGIPLHNMDQAWWDQVAVEHTTGGSTETTAGMWVAPGDSSLVVDLTGRRVGNEKTFYHDRAKLHLGDNAPQLLLLLFDARTAKLFSCEDFAYPLVSPGEPASHIVSGNTWDEVAAEVARRLERLREVTGGAQLSDDFTNTLRATVRRYNEIARAGEDLDFGRGREPIELFFHGPARPDGGPDPTMAALTAEGPYHAVLIGLGTLDTKGGPRTSPHAQVLGRHGSAIDGLYAVGNCAASPSNGGYWAAGATIGPALAFGYAAGRHLGQRRVALQTSTRTRRSTT
ncbi:FAD-dependent oxidoreductase [Streptomyces sp. NPDC047009]|uniref:FAD-dependent oxidoreductase n=1 Tax=Streptomyces sp. NPDC047009 TaxID=3154496 RepID=UPI0033DCD40D